MKNLFFLIAILLFVLSSCTKEDAPKPFSIDGTSMVYIKPSKTTKKFDSRSQVQSKHLSPLEIVKQATTMRFYNYNVTSTDIAAGFAGKDITSPTPAFLKYGFEIINKDGFGKVYIDPLFIGAQDCVIEIFRSNKDIDTIAYIPNSVFLAAKIKINEALINKDTAAVYEAFKNSFTFIPITGPEYKELKRQKLQ